MHEFTVRLIKPLKGHVVRYEGHLLQYIGTSLILRAVWQHEAVDLGLFRFEPGDQLDEYFYTDRWYCIFAVADASGRRKGWYCNIARPALITADSVNCEDLELDLIVSADRQMRLDDEAEFAARQFETGDPAAHAAALAAVASLRELAQRDERPFQSSWEGDRS